MYHWGACIHLLRQYSFPTEAIRHGNTGLYKPSPKGRRCVCARGPAHVRPLHPFMHPLHFTPSCIRSTSPLHASAPPPPRAARCRLSDSRSCASSSSSCPRRNRMHVIMRISNASTTAADSACVAHSGYGDSQRDSAASDALLPGTHPLTFSKFASLDWSFVSWRLTIWVMSDWICFSSVCASERALSAAAACSTSAGSSS